MDTPDIASIVNMIMSNPSLVEQIASMANREQSATPDTSSEGEVKPENEIPVEAPSRETNDRRVHRVRLANAMKPYLSEGRRRAIDAMMSIADILDITREKK